MQLKNIYFFLCLPNLNPSQMVFCFQQMRKVCDPFRNSQCPGTKDSKVYSKWNGSFLSRKVGNTVNYFEECSQDLYFILFWYALLSSLCGMVREFKFACFFLIILNWKILIDIWRYRHVQNYFSLRRCTCNAEPVVSYASSRHSQKFKIFMCNLDD